MATAVPTVSSNQASSSQGDEMLMWDMEGTNRLRWTQLGKQGVSNTVVDGMRLMDEMIINGGGDDVDGMGDAEGELDGVAEEMDFQLPQGNNVLVQVNDVSDQAVPSTHDVRAEIEMQEQSVREGNPNRRFSHVNTGALIPDDDVLHMEEVEMTPLPGEEVRNAEISDPIAPFGDDDDDFSFGGDNESDQLNCSSTSTQSMEVMWKFLSQSTVKWTAFMTISTMYAPHPRCHRRCRIYCNYARSRHTTSRPRNTTLPNA